MFTFLPTLPVQLEVWKFAIWSDIFVQSIQRFRWKSTEELCLMTLKSYAKFEEKLTCGFKYDMRNLVNIHPTTQKSKNFSLMDYFCPKYMRFELKKIERSYLLWHWTVMQSWNIPWPCGFKNGMRNWVNFQWTTQKSQKLYIDGLFLSKAYNVSVRRFQRNHVSWYGRVLQNLKENWLVTWKMTLGIWLTFMWAVESLKVCTLIGSFCPKHTKI